MTRCCDVFFAGWQATPIECALPEGHVVKPDPAIGHVGIAADGQLVGFGGSALGALPVLSPAIGDSILTVRLPWALLFFPPFGDKDVENRDWSTKIRGRVWIHASHTMKRDEYTEAADFAGSIGRPLPEDSFVRRFLGCVIGSVVIEDCVQRSSSPWFFGHYGFVIRDPELVNPISAIGNRGWWRWDPASPRQVGHFR